MTSLSTTNVPYHIETSQFICTANQLTDSYLMGTLVFNGLKTPQNFVEETFSIKLTKILTEIRGEVLYTFAGMTRE